MPGIDLVLCRIARLIVLLQRQLRDAARISDRWFLDRSKTTTSNTVYRVARLLLPEPGYTIHSRVALIPRDLKKAKPWREVPHPREDW